jgi:hypothetical protein
LLNNLITIFCSNLNHFEGILLIIDFIYAPINFI